MLSFGGGGGKLKKKKKTVQVFSGAAAELQFLLSIASTGQGHAQGRLSLTDLERGLKEAPSPKRAPQRPDEAQLLHGSHGKQAPKGCIAAAIVS